MNNPTMETLARRLDRVERENRRLKRVGVVALVGIIAWGTFLGGFPVSALAAKKINLLRLEKSGTVVEINPATHLIFKSLNEYLLSRFRGKIVEAQTDECRDGGLGAILIRYEEEEYGAGVSFLDKAGKVILSAP
ncbi:MAG: hypothetical protein V3W08_05115 [Candidatus Binatia bacterium]